MKIVLQTVFRNNYNDISYLLLYFLFFLRLFSTNFNYTFQMTMWLFCCLLYFKLSNLPESTQGTKCPMYITSHAHAVIHVSLQLYLHSSSVEDVLWFLFVCFSKFKFNIVFVLHSFRYISVMNSFTWIIFLFYILY